MGDLFSTRADGYLAHRPTYPDELFDWAASLAPDRSLAWDCACGSGQATAELARHFEHVIATDASGAQVAQAERQRLTSRSFGARHHRPTKRDLLGPPMAANDHSAAYGADDGPARRPNRRTLVSHRETLVPGTSSHDARHVGLGSVTFRVERAERSSIESGSVSLTMVAQALHWLDHSAFYPELRRVSKSGAALVAVTYHLINVVPEVDRVVRDFNAWISPYWPPERGHVENRYTDIPFELPRISVPPLAMEAAWSVDRLVGYLRSWTATARYEETTGRDALADWAQPIRTAWGPDHTRRVRWPLTILAGRVS